MATFTWAPDWQAAKKNKPKVIKHQFGDGYEQRFTDGINSNMEEWGVTFKRSPEVITLIDDFLSSMNGTESFNWTTPKGVSKVFKCEEWDTRYEDVGWSTLTATFVQVPEVVAA